MIHSREDVLAILFVRSRAPAAAALVVHYCRMLESIP